MTLNLCQANHETHDSKLIETKYGPFWIWKWDLYRGFAGYCPGQDDVSMSLDLYGDWERPDIARMRQILTEKPGKVLDFGAHIGWYGVQAARMGCDVYFVEADPENFRLLERNLEDELGETHAWSTRLAWVAELDYEINDEGGIRFLKSDVEGAEDDVIHLTERLWQNRLIDHALLEISPVFKPYYPALVDELIGYGYDAFIIKDETDWHITGADVVFPQENVWFRRL